MQIDYVFAAVSSRDLAIAEAFYTTVLGREPDDRPMPTLIQWRGVANAGIQVFLDTDKPGGGSMTLVVANVETVAHHLTDAGYAAGDIRQGDFGRILRVRDPDGNALFFAEPPKNPG